MSEMVEKVAMAIADLKGDQWDYVPLNKSDWIAHRGSFGSRFRDVDEPFKSDYREMARAAIKALMEPTETMLVDSGTIDGWCQECSPRRGADAVHIEWWQDMLTTALEESDK